jgi:hypothetical protein
MRNDNVAFIILALNSHMFSQQKTIYSTVRKFGISTVFKAENNTAVRNPYILRTHKITLNL